ncbi:hypothetical protein V5G20_04540 [Brevibacillus borstelensis]|uniref:hypothetical protein n=1 Tax=Brevibacillus borstelensis TaxID=45462 RepID=UPI0030CFB6C9
MAEINYIRHEANKKGRAYSKIAKQMNRDSRTVQKYAEMDDFNLQEKPKQIRKARGVNVNQNVDHSAHQKIDHHGKNQSTRRVGNFFMITIFECSV